MSRPKVIFELTQPGTWLDMEDRDLGFKVNGFISSAISAFYGGNAALWLFEDAYDRSIAASAHSSGRGEWEVEAQRRREIEESLRSQHGHFDGLYEQAGLLLKREQWQQGKLPRQIESAFVFLHAHSFLYSVDEIGKFLEILANTEGAPERARTAAKRFDVDLPQVREIRNSAAHKEDRQRGPGPRKKPISQQPIDEYGISAPGGGVMVMSTLYNQTLVYTVADGRTVGLDVTVATLEVVRDIIQELLNAFPWRGPASHYPS